MSQPSAVAMVLTPLREGKALAAMCRLSGVDALCLTTDAGSLAVLADAEEGAATHSMAVISAALRGVPVLALRRGPTDMPEPDVQAGRWSGGRKVEDVAPGLALAGLPEQVERILLGLSDPGEIPDAIAAKSLSKWSATRALASATRAAKKAR